MKSVAYFFGLCNPNYKNIIKIFKNVFAYKSLWDILENSNTIIKKILFFRIVPIHKVKFF